LIELPKRASKFELHLTFDNEGRRGWWNDAALPRR